MTTAELRNAARAAEARLDWQGAARLWDLAADRHPGHRNPRGLGAMDAMDIANMRAKAASHRAFAA
jgi:hypothetical protein